MSTYYVQCVILGGKTMALIIVLKAYVTLAKVVGQTPTIYIYEIHYIYSEYIYIYIERKSY